MTQDEYDQRLYDAIAALPGATSDILLVEMTRQGVRTNEQEVTDELVRMLGRHQIVAYWEYPLDATAENLDKQPRTRHYRVEEGERPGGEK